MYKPFPDRLQKQLLCNDCASMHLFTEADHALEIAQRVLYAMP